MMLNGIWTLAAATPAFAQETATAAATAAATATLPHDLSAWGMIENAGWVVKTVIGILFAASILSWTVALVKLVELIVSGRRVRRVLDTLHAARNLDEAVDQLERAGGVGATLIDTAAQEVAVSGAGMPKEGVKERAAWRMERLVARAGRRLGRGGGILATTGAVAPFVGLFGTVWGIMNAFIGISRTQTTNLAVVAPGIAEALLATAIGLVAAIPAVVIYNALARGIGNQKALYADAVAEVMRLLSRELDRVTPGELSGEVPLRLRAVGD